MRIAITGAAEALGQTVSAVSRALGRLEEKLGVTLLTRTTRSVKLTEAGGRYVEDCRRILGEIAEAEAAAAGAHATPTGTLVVTASVLFGNMYVLPIVTEFLRIVLRMPALPVLARPVQRLLVRAAVDCLPGWTRTRLALDGPDWSLPPAGTALLRRLARGADRLVLSTNPGVQACARLGLAPEALYRDGP